MKAKPPDHAVRRVAVILGPGGSSRNLLNVVLPLLGKDRSIEMQGVFLEEAELKHAAELPFVKELCRVTFSVREFDSEQFDRVLALRMRTARRALSVLARRAGVAHSFRNVRGSAVGLLRETADQSDITVFEPVRTMAAAMSSRPYQQQTKPHIVVALSDLEHGRGALIAALHLANGDWRRVSMLLTPSVAADSQALDRWLRALLPSRPAQIRTLSGPDIYSLIDSARALGSSMLVLSATPELMVPENLRILRQRLSCPVCLVRYWGEKNQPQTVPAGKRA